MNHPSTEIEFEGRKYVMKGWGYEDHIFNVLVKYKTFYEVATLKIIREAGATGAFLDVGANIGNHSVFFAQECGASHVFMFEPVAELCEIATENMKNNAKCPWTLEQAIVSNNPDAEMGLWVSKPENMGRSKIDNASELRVRNIRLDDYFREYDGKIGLIKIDVEGAEAFVLQGALSIIKKHHPVIAAEAFGGYGMTAAEELKKIRAILEAMGYWGPKAAFAGDIPFYVWRA